MADWQLVLAVGVYGTAVGLIAALLIQWLRGRK
jgi:hypothetical protein